MLAKGGQLALDAVSIGQGQKGTLADRTEGRQGDSLACSGPSLHVHACLPWPWLTVADWASCWASPWLVPL